MTDQADELNDAHVLVAAEAQRARHAVENGAQLHGRHFVVRPRLADDGVAVTELRVERLHAQPAEHTPVTQLVNGKQTHVE